MKITKLLKYWFIYYSITLLGFFAFSFGGSLFAQLVVKSSPYLQRLEPAEIRSSITLPITIFIYAITPFWSFFVFRLVALKMLKANSQDQTT